MWKTIKSKVLFEHPRVTLIEDIVELPNGNQVPYLKYGNKNDSVAIICIKNNKVLVQQEYSYPPNEVLLQFPGGKIEGNESIIDAAKRELIEESGYYPKDTKLLGWFYPDNRRSNSKMYIVLVSNLNKTVKSGGDLEEDITSKWIDISEIDEKIKNDKIHNYSILAGWSFYKAYSNAPEKPNF